ncbi:MAG TPA: LPS export ABC transporter permease LptF [Gammaproteobacteria bacterium]|nr:LPS export ABC transporter permease LptF [Gammaproteobacteria bacterium]
MPLVLHRYLGRELLHYWLLIAVVLWLVLVTARFSLYLGQAAAGRLPAVTVLSLLALKSVAFFVFLLPLALFLALLWLLGRLNRDHESLALAACGVGPRQWYRAFAVPVLGIAVLVAALSWYLVPFTNAMGYRLRAAAEQQVDAAVLQPGRFHQLRHGRWLLFARRAGEKPGALEDVFVHVRGAQGPQLLVAKRAVVHQRDGEPFLSLYHGRRYQGQPGRADYRVLEYDEYGIRLKPQAPEPVRKWDAVPTATLRHQPGPQARAEWQQRLSRPISVLVLALMALPLGRFRPGSGRYYPLWLGVLLFTLYFNLLGTGQIWLERGVLPSWLGLWWVHVLVPASFFAWLALWRRLARPGRKG